MMNDKDIASMARLIDTDAQEVKSRAASMLTHGVHATAVIEELTRARKLENVALSLRSLIVQDRTVKASAPSPCSCESDNNEHIQPIGRGGLSY